MAKPFLVLQLRPEDQAADDEFAAILRFGGLDVVDAHRVRMEKEDIPTVDLDDYAAVIIGGGPSNVSDTEETKPIEQRRFEAQLRPLMAEIVERDFPFLGACYGIGVLAQALGGKVSKKHGEGVGAVELTLTKEGEQDPLMQGSSSPFKAFAGHKEACEGVPPGAVVLVSSAACPVHMIRTKSNVYATQFHPELDNYGLEVRINLYKHAGYFPPEDADMLIAAGHKEQVSVPMEILKRFVERYRG